MDVTNYNELINSSLDKDFEFLFAVESPPASGEIEAFEREIGCSLPEDFKVLISSYLNGFYAEAKEEVWPRKQGGAYWMFQYALVVYGLDAGLPDWVNLRAQVKTFRQNTDTDLTPFMRTIASREPYCFTRTGNIVKWSVDRESPECIDMAFFDVFKLELSNIQKLKQKVVTDKI
ncbi:MAG: SMI1/KNR4 family protein [Oceanospirillaceae bacterium]|nr:SMI1/KNR4 family protein [Oceanospirillaceae bacterium]MCP5349616.1 SMI1/KNR4 family protein [Oceanospirillaceae bacterium]